MNTIKKLILILSIIAIASQAQEGINYQGVATNNSGAELINQNISVQTSIISDSATGTIQWQETHNTTTDQFGLFNLIIGQGASTGSGLSSSFDNIQWGSGNHYLKIEMDATGGSNYSLISTSQMMSVPYALYAKNAGMDSTMLANMIGTSIGGGSNSGNGSSCDVIYPEGYSGEILTYNFSSNYIVPAGKNLTLLSVSGQPSSSVEYLYLNGKFLSKSVTYGGVSRYGNEKGDISFRLPLIIGEGDTLSTWHTNQGGNSPMVLNGFLTDKNVESIYHSLCEDNVSWNGSSFDGIFEYVVPSEKKLIIQAFFGENLPYPSKITIDGYDFLDLDDNKLNMLSTPLQLSSGQVLGLSNPSGSNVPRNIHFIGYLVDEDYFADCGGGSSSSTIDSSYIDSLIQFYSSINEGDCDWKFPDGYSNEIVNLEISSSNTYTVPAGKSLYILHTQIGAVGTGHFIIDGINILSTGGNGLNYSWEKNHNPILVQSGSTLSSSGGFCSFSGFLINEGVEIINHNLNNNYTVPAGKTLYVMHAQIGAVSAGHFKIDGINILSTSGNGLNYSWEKNHNTIVAQSGSTLSSSGGFCSFSGYLVVEDYFEDCRSGSNSSLNNSLNNASVLYSPSNYPQNIYEGSFFYFSTSVGIGGSDYFVVPSGKNLYLDDITQSGVSCRIVSSGNTLEIGSPSYLEQVILCEGDTIEIFHHGNTSSTGIFYTWGYLVDINNNIDILKISLDTSSFTYTVPSDKKLIVELIIADAVNDITVTLENNQSFTAYPNMPTQAHFLDPNTTIQANLGSASNPKYIIIGYLIDHQ